jgi:hypothetical protein
MARGRATRHATAGGVLQVAHRGAVGSEHRGGRGDTTMAATAHTGDRRKRRGSGRSELQPMPRAVRRGKAAGRAWPEASVAAHGWNCAGDARVARTEEAQRERLGESREGLMARSHAEVTEREEKRATDTWDREGAGVHMAVAHRGRADGAGLQCGSGQVQPVKKKIDFEYRKLFFIQRRTENNSKEIARCL